MVDELMKRANALLDKLLDHNLQVDAQTGAAQIVDELMADRKTMQRGLTAWKKQCDTLTHQVICCGVAAGHPDATLTTHGAYANEWNSAQAEEVRKLRAECDQMREERTAWRVTAENAEAALAALKASLSGPVAVIGSGFALYWAGSEPIAPIVEKHGLKVGSPLYALKETT